MRTRLVFAFLLSALLVVEAPSAHAQSCEAPPGSAAVDQYCEAIPEGDGSQSGSDFRRQSAESSAGREQDDGSALPAAALKQLQSAGSDGGSVANLARAARDTRQPLPGGNNEAGEVAGATASSDAGSGSPLKALSASVQNGPIAGSLLIWGLLGSTVAVLSVGWIRHRGGDTDAPD